MNNVEAQNKSTSRSYRCEVLGDPTEKGPISSCIRHFKLLSSFLKNSSPRSNGSDHDETRASLHTELANIVYSAPFQEILALLVGQAHDLIASILKRINRNPERLAASWCIDGIQYCVSHELGTGIFWEFLADILHHDCICAFERSVHVFGSYVAKRRFASIGKMIRA